MSSSHAHGRHGSSSYKGTGVSLTTKSLPNKNEISVVQRAQPQGPSPRAPPVDEHYGGTTNEQIYSQWGISQPPPEPPQVQAQRDGENAAGRPRSQSNDSPEKNRGRQAAAPGQVGGSRVPKFIQELEKHRKGINYDN